MPILHAPILEQAGFVSGALEPVKNYVARSDGVSQYWELSEPVNILPNDVIRFGLSKFTDVGAFRRFFGSSDFTFSLDSGADGDKFRLRRVTDGLINGETITSDVTLIPTTGSNDVEVVSGEIRSISTLLSLGTTNLASAAMYEFRVIRNGTVIHEIPLTNRSQGATQLATVGNVNATMVGYNPDVWEEV